MKPIFILCMLSVLLAAPALHYDAWAELAERTNLDGTVLLKFVIPEADEIRVWPSGGAEFTSFKTEQGWDGEINSAGVLVAASPEPRQAGESVKIGLKSTDNEVTINWKILNGGQEESSGFSFYEPDTPEAPPGIRDSADIRIVPSNPAPGTDFRVVGQGFDANQALTLELDGTPLGGSFASDASGSFVVTGEVPAGAAGTVSIEIRDAAGDAKSASIDPSSASRAPSQTADASSAPLAISSIDSSILPGGTLTVSGTGPAGEWIWANLENNENLLTSEVVQVASDGSWNIEGRVLRSSPAGEYAFTVFTGQEEDTSVVAVGSERILDFESSRTQFAAGNDIVFEGRAQAGTLDATILDPDNVIVYQELISVDGTDEMEIRHPTLDDSVPGTYTLIARQGSDVSTAVAGLDEEARENLLMVFDKSVYADSESATISITGIRGTTVTLEFEEEGPNSVAHQEIPFDTERGESIIHEEDLSWLTSGTYKATARSSGAESTFRFALNPTDTGEIESFSVGGEHFYKVGENIHAIIKTQFKNTLLDLEVRDTDNQVVVSRVLFTSHDGLAREIIHIPADAEIGRWVATVTSGSNSLDQSFEIIPEDHTGMLARLISVSDVAGSPIISIKVEGGTGGAIIDLLLEDPSGAAIWENVEDHTGEKTRFSEEGVRNIVHTLATDYEDGTYIMNITDTRTRMTVQVPIPIS